MRPARRLAILPVLAVLSLLVPTQPAAASGPRNPYSGFNLSGINYGAQQWDRDQRAGRVVWPYYNVPGRGTVRGSTATVGGFGGAGTAGVVVTGGTVRPAPRAVRRWRR